MLPSIRSSGIPSTQRFGWIGEPSRKEVTAAVKELSQATGIPANEIELASMALTPTPTPKPEE
jgi:hypothetical protein